MTTKIKGFTPASDYLCQEFDPLIALVYGKIWRYTDWGGECSASLDRIAKELGVSSQTVRRKLRILEDRGFIEQKSNNIGRTIVWVPTGKLDFVATVEEVQPLPESQGSDSTPTTESYPPYQRVRGTPTTESYEDSIKDTEEDIIIRRKLSSTFWTSSKIPEPSPASRGWQEWNDGLDDLVKIKATAEEVSAAVVKLDEIGYGYTGPGSTVKTIINMRKSYNKKDKAAPGVPLAKV